MSRLVVVLPLSPLREGHLFQAGVWPLHITVVPPFHTDAAPSAVATAIASVASAHPPLVVVAGGPERFGRRHDVPVTVLVENESLTLLHHRLLAAIRPLVAPAGSAAGHPFRPHVTTRHRGSLGEGDTLTLTQLALVDMAPGGSRGERAVVATVDLSGSSPA